MLPHEEKALAVELAIELSILQRGAHGSGYVSRDPLRVNIAAVLPLLYPLPVAGGLVLTLTEAQRAQAVRILGLQHYEKERDAFRAGQAVVVLLALDAPGAYEDLGEEFKGGGSGVRDAV